MTIAKSPTELRIYMQPDSVQCKVHDIDLACQAVPAHLRDTLMLPPGTQVALVAPPNVPFQPVADLIQGLQAAGYELAAANLAAPIVGAGGD